MWILNLDVWYSHRPKLESLFSKNFKYWKIYTQNKANLCSTDFPSQCLESFLWLEQWNFQLCDTLPVIEQNTIKQQGISSHKTKISLCFLLFRTIIWQLNSKDIPGKNPWRRRKSTWTQGFAFHCFSAGQRKGSWETGLCAVYNLNRSVERRALSVWLSPGARHSFTQKITPETA